MKGNKKRLVMREGKNPKNEYIARIELQVKDDAGNWSISQLYNTPMDALFGITVMKRNEMVRRDSSTATTVYTDFVTRDCEPVPYAVVEEFMPAWKNHLVKLTTMSVDIVSTTYDIELAELQVNSGAEIPSEEEYSEKIFW